MSEQPTETVTPGSPGADRPAVLPRGTVVGRYVVLDLLGSGGMGVVYAAYDPELDRKVALKLLRPDRVREDSRLRLLREAQAVAQLSHPNVVAVYDAGTLDEDRVFVAMELVVGRNLVEWLAQAEPSPREVLAALAEAGRGLAAAHAAGMVHRDVKPENVLIGEDGRVRMADFGLARRREEGKASGALTSPGMVVGTPSYMSPEQRRGDPIDARSDQYSFCRMVWEALFKRKPPAGEDRRVPSRVRQALLRGLRDDPAERHPSLEPLLAELQRDPAVARRRWLAAAAVVLAGGAAFVAWERGQESRPLCRGAEARRAGVWSEERKKAVGAAFLATGAPYARGVGATVERSLDGYMAGWSAMHREACEATWVRGEQSEALLDRRMFCLKQRLHEAEALVNVFAQADARTVEKAAGAVSALPSIESCAGPSVLSMSMPPPTDPQVQSRVEALQSRLARARALGSAGKYRDGLAVAREVFAVAAQTPYPPLAAEAQLVQGDLEEKAGEAENAARTLLAALAGAEAAGHDEVKARAAILRLRVLGLTLGRFDEAHQWGAFASAVVARLGRDDLRAEELSQLGIIDEAEGKYPAALEKIRQALEIRRRLGAPAQDLAIGMSDVGLLQYRLGHYPEARRLFTEALALQKEALGPEHPEVADSLNRIGGSYYIQGLDAEALDFFQQALALRAAALGPVHRLVADSLTNVASAHDDLGQSAKALTYYQRAYQIQRQLFGDRHPDLALTLDNMGNVYFNQGRVREALQHHQDALEMRIATLGPDHPKTASTLYHLAEDLSLAGRHREALSRHRQALAIRQRALGADHPDVAASLTAVAKSELRLGEARQALAQAERAFQILQGPGLDPLETAATRFVLAPALWQTGGDRQRALKLVQQALAGLAPKGALEKTLRDELETWLADRERG